MCACSGREGGQIRSESSKCVFVTKIIHVRAPMHLYHVRVCILGAAEIRATLEAEVLTTDTCDMVASRHSHHHYLTGNVRTKLILYVYGDAAGMLATRSSKIYFIN